MNAFTRNIFLFYGFFFLKKGYRLAIRIPICYIYKKNDAHNDNNIVKTPRVRTDVRNSDSINLVVEFPTIMIDSDGFYGPARILEYLIV